MQTILGRSPAEVCVTFQDNLQQIIGSCQTTREAGAPSWQVYFIGDWMIDSHQNRWKPLEAGLAAIGSQAEDILECLEEEQDSARQKPLDIEHLLANVIPSLLQLTGEYICISLLSLAHVVCKSSLSCKGEGSFSQVSLPRCYPCRWLGSILR